MSKYASKGTKWKWTISSVLTEVAQVTSITGPEAQAELFDTTSLDGTVGREFTWGGHNDYGEAKIDGFLDPAAATFKAITADFVAGTSRAFSLAWSDGTSSWTGTAYVKSVGGSASEGNPLRFSSSFRTTGNVTYPT